MALLQSYLVSYNAASAAGWALVLAQLVNALSNGNSVRTAVHTATPAVIMLQLVSTLELLHVLVGITRGGAAQTFMQIGGRDIVLFMTVVSFTQVQQSWFAFALYATWAVSELIRYPYYALSQLHCCPKFLHYLRYTAFTVLYPIGFAAEIGCFIRAYAPAKVSAQRICKCFGSNDDIMRSFDAMFVISPAEYRLII
jgi:very-long-chain (3R)-3-hydroxyacyl-CoA dehydratase